MAGKKKAYLDQYFDEEQRLNVDFDQMTYKNMHLLLDNLADITVC